MTTCVLNSITKLARNVKIRSTNGIDENNAIVINKNDNKQVNPNYERERKHTYYEKNKQKLTEYYHEHYLLNKEEILQKKREYNKLPEVKARSSEYHKNYYQDHKEELKLKHREYSKNRKRKKKK